MLYAKTTPNYAGVIISGDYRELDALYMALHMIVGNESDYRKYEGPRLRVLGVCYDIRHAIMGDGEIEFVDNGMDEFKMKLLEVVTPTKNLQFSFKIYFPELFFVMMALNDFIRLHAKTKAKQATFPLMDKRVIWDGDVARVRLFQSIIAECLKESVSEASYTRIFNLLHHEYSWLGGYATQYLDMLNIEFLYMGKEERKKKLLTMAKRISEQGKEYQKVKREVEQSAREYQCPVENIRLKWEYPEKIEW